jgi:glycosyltransferase involved in cell wall biosynthesis
MIFYAETNRRRYISMGIDPRKLFVARNLIDITPIKVASDQWGDGELAAFKLENGLSSRPVLLSVGRLLHRKRLDLLIEAAKKMQPEFPDLQVVLIGDGPEMVALCELTKKTGMHGNIQFLGKITEESKIAPWFLSADIVVAPGQIGHLATHAHAYGVPLVVASDRSVQGPEIDILLPGRTGLTYIYDDLESLTATITKLLRDKSQRDVMAHESRRRADEFCNIKQMASGFIDAVLYVTS